MVQQQAWSAMAHISGAKPRMETKRKLDEGVRNWDGGNADSDAFVHSCLILSCSSEVTQLIEDILAELTNGSYEIIKRARMDLALTGKMILVCSYCCE